MLNRSEWPKTTVRESATGIVLMTLGALLGAVQVAVFMVPANVVPGGVSSLGLILNHLFGFPIGVVVLIANIPIQFIGYRMLGGWRMLVRTIYVVVLYSVAVDLLAAYVPVEGISQDRLLNALFGGALGGIASGLIYRASSSFGGTSTLALILQNKSGTPMSTTFLYTDAALIGAAGLTFGWESALYAVMALVVSGLATDYIMEGPSVIRTAVIVTDAPREVADAIISRMAHTVTGWNAQGMYTNQPHTVLYVTIPRSEANLLRQTVFEVDPSAFMVIGQGHAAYGSTFRSGKRIAS